MLKNNGGGDNKDLLYTPTFWTYIDECFYNSAIHPILLTHVARQGLIIVSNIPAGYPHDFYWPVICLSKPTDPNPDGPSNPDEQDPSDDEDNPEDITVKVYFDPKPWTYNNYAVVKAKNYPYESAFVGEDKAITPPAIGEWTTSELAEMPEHIKTDGLVYSTTLAYDNEGATLLNVSDHDNFIVLDTLCFETFGVDPSSTAFALYYPIIEAQAGTNFVLRIDSDVDYDPSKDSLYAGVVWLKHQYFAEL